jgi:paired amphipathic helix protein Sin3a
MKKRLGNEKLYSEFLKCLNLFSQKIITRLELVVLVRDILGQYPDLFDRFKKFIGFADEEELELPDKKDSGPEGDDKEMKDAEKWAPASDADIPISKRIGPSYRALPRSVCAHLVLYQTTGLTKMTYFSRLQHLAKTK